MGQKPRVEVEIKLPVASKAAVRRGLRAAGFRRVRRRMLEVNWIMDDARGSLRRVGRLLRLRCSGTQWILTAKGPSKPGRHKRRDEIETEVSDGPACRKLLQTLGFEARFVYERYRTTYRHADGGEGVLDETPLGDFLELEGKASWIDRAAKALGYRRQQYILTSYVGLFEAYVAHTGSRARQFTFAEMASAKGKRGRG